MKGGAQGQRFGVLINRLWGLREQVTPADVAPEILPTADVTSSRFEYLAPRAEVGFSCSRSQAPFAGELSYVALNNPVGSRRCVVLEDVSISATQEADIRLIREAFNTPVGALGSRDSRALPSTLQLGLSGGTLPAVVGTDLGRFTLLTTPRPFAVVLAPGSALLFFGVTVNTGLGRLMMLGYHRPCSPEEMRV